MPEVSESQNELSQLNYDALIVALRAARMMYPDMATVEAQLKQFMGMLGNLPLEEKTARLNQFLEERGVEESISDFTTMAAKTRDTIIKGERIAFALEAEKFAEIGANTQAINMAREAIEKAYGTAEEIAGYCEKHQIETKAPDREAIKNDLISFFMYVAAQDKAIGTNEVAIANSVFDVTLNSEYWQQLLESDDEFFEYQHYVANTVVTLYALAQTVDSQDEEDGTLASACADGFIRLYSFVGLLAALSDGSADEVEIEYVGKYIDDLNKFFCDNASRLSSTAVEFNLSDMRQLRIRQVPQGELAAAALLGEVVEQIESVHASTGELLSAVSTSPVKGLIDSIKLIKHEKAHKSELKGKKNQLEKDRDQLKYDKAVYQDNLYILANYDKIIPRQEQIIVERTAEIEDLKPKLVAAEAALAAAAAALAAAKSKHRKELAPYESQRSGLESRISAAKDKISEAENLQRDFENQASSAEGFDRTSLQSSARMQERQVHAYESDLSALESELSSLESTIKSIESRHSAELIPLDAAVAAAGFTVSSLSSSLDKAEKALVAAQQRIQRCNHVVAHPDETPALAEKIQVEEQSVASQSAIVDGMEEDLERFKEATKKGKITIGVGIGIVVAAIVALVLIFAVFPNSSPTSNPTMASSRANQETIEIDDYVAMSVPDFNYTVETNSENSITSYSSTSFTFMVSITDVESNNMTSREALLDMYDGIFETVEENGLLMGNSVAYGTISRGSFEKGNLIGSTQEMTLDSNSAMSFTCFVDTRLYYIVFAWAPGYSSGKISAQNAVDSFHALNSSASSLSSNSASSSDTDSLVQGERWYLINGADIEGAYNDSVWTLSGDIRVADSSDAVFEDDAKAVDSFSYKMPSGAPSYYGSGGTAGKQEITAEQGEETFDSWINHGSAAGLAVLMCVSDGTVVSIQFMS